MTTAPYSLREKVIAFLESGNDKTKAALVFKLHRKTVGMPGIKMKAIIYQESDWGQSLR